MCRNIKTLFNFEPPASDDEIEAASLEFVRKLSGYTRPSRANEEVFDRAVRDVSRASCSTRLGQKPVVKWKLLRWRLLPPSVSEAKVYEASLRHGFLL